MSRSRHYSILGGKLRDRLVRIFFFGAALASVATFLRAPSISQIPVDRRALQGGADFVGSALGRASGKCLPCAADDGICARWGAEAILRSRDYLGTGIRTRRILNALRNGNASIGVLGGSMSACVDVNVTDCYPGVLARSLDAHFNVLPTVHNGALSATGSDFFAECWPLRLHAEVDLVLVEFSVNDPPDYINRGVATLLHSLLSLPDPPAIILLDLYSPRSSNWYSGTGSITTLGPYFDLPVISQKNVLYHHRHARQTDKDISTWWSTAQGRWKMGHHPSPLGHQLIADLILSYILEMSCLDTVPTRHIDRSDRGPMNISYFDNPDWLPWDKYHELASGRKDRHMSECLTAAPGDQRIVPHNSSRGFTFGDWKGKFFIWADKPGDRLVVQGVQRHFGILVFYWVSRSLGFGKVKCWVVGLEDEAVILDGYRDTDINGPIAAQIPVGSHRYRNSTFICEIQKLPKRQPGVKAGTEFRFTAIAW